MLASSCVQVSHLRAHVGDILFVINLGIFFFFWGGGVLWSDLLSFAVECYDFQFFNILKAASF